MSGKKLCLRLIWSCILCALICGLFAFCIPYYVFINYTTWSSTAIIIISSIAGAATFVGTLIENFKSTNKILEKEFEKSNIDFKN